MIVLIRGDPQREKAGKRRPEAGVRWGGIVFFGVSNGTGILSGHQYVVETSKSVTPRRAHISFMPLPFESEDSDTKSYSRTRGPLPGRVPIYQPEILQLTQ